MTRSKIPMMFLLTVNKGGTSVDVRTERQERRLVGVGLRTKGPPEPISVPRGPCGPHPAFNLDPTLVGRGEDTPVTYRGTL